jgi:hypothetical protein
MLSNETVDQAVNRVAASGGIFDKERWRADRIVRTEMNYSYGVANQKCLEHTAREVPHLFKRIVETMDGRTGKDSVQLNGQVQPVNKPFIWMKQTKHGTERVEYFQPPNRSNDRGLSIPWRSDYPEPAAKPGPVTPRMPGIA